MGGGGVALGVASFNDMVASRLSGCTGGVTGAVWGGGVAVASRPASLQVWLACVFLSSCAASCLTPAASRPFTRLRFALSLPLTGERQHLETQFCRLLLAEGDTG